MIDAAVQNAYSLARLTNQGKTESRETWIEKLGNFDLFLFILIKFFSNFIGLDLIKENIENRYKRAQMENWHGYSLKTQYSKYSKFPGKSI